MKLKIAALIVFLTVFNLLFAKEKEEKESWEYYDAEKVKISRTHRLTVDGNYRWPRWSSDGKKISADNYYGLQIFEFKENGKEIEKIGEIPEYTDYTWSPDGNSIVYSLNEDGTGLSLWLLKIGKEKEKLKIISNERLITNGGTNLSWSPDGKKIVFSGDKSLVLLDSDGTNRRVLIEGEKVWEPKFISNDEILYLKGPIEVEFEPGIYAFEEMRHLFKLNIIANKETSLLPEKIIGEFNVVTIEKKKGKLYCVVERGEEVFIINLDMTQKVELPGKTGVQDFSPDGSKIVDVKIEIERDIAVASEIYVMNTNGKGMKQLTNTSNIIEDDVRWSPDGKWLLYINVTESSIYVSKLTRHND